jgi:hypothetical protein
LFPLVDVSGFVGWFGIAGRSAGRGSHKNFAPAVFCLHTNLPFGSTCPAVHALFLIATTGAFGVGDFVVDVGDLETVGALGVGVAVVGSGLGLVGTCATPIPFSINTRLINSTSPNNWVTVVCEALSVDVLVVKVQPPINEMRDITAEIAITFGSETPFPEPLNIASIFWSASESLTPSLFLSVGTSSL